MIKSIYLGHKTQYERSSHWVNMADHPDVDYVNKIVFSCCNTVSFLGSSFFMYFVLQNKLKLVSHWDATILRLVGDKGLPGYKCDVLTIFTLR